MRSNRMLAILIALCLITVWIAMVIRPHEELGLSLPIRPWLLGAVLTLASIVIISNVGIGDLMQGTIIRPLGLKDIFYVPFRVPNLLVVNAMVAVLLSAYACRYKESSKSLRYSRWILAPLCLVLSRGIGLSAALPTVWLASTGTSGMPRAREAELAPEVPLLSILLFLTIFPVAGSQLSLATLMLVPVVVDISACLYEDIRSFLHRSKRIEMLFCLTIATIQIGRAHV